jgi:chemotaxis protein MotB
MRQKLMIASTLLSIFLFSCVSSKKFKKSQADYAELQTKLTQVQGDLGNCNDARLNYQGKNLRWKMIKQI